MWTEEQDQGVRALTALTEFLDSVTSTHMAANNHVQLQFQGSKAFLWPLQALGTQVVARHIRKQNT